MKIRILGCGTSSGVPMVGCACNVCRSNNIRNKRTRVSAIVESADAKILLDTPPDLRMQLLSAGISNIDAVLYTHAHADHVHGIDDLRSINFMKKSPIEAFGSADTLRLIKQRFDYAFIKKGEILNNYWTRPALIAKELMSDKEDHICINGLKVEHFKQTHGNQTTTGYIFDSKIAYSTDFNHIEVNILESLKGINLWIIDCLGYDNHPTHSNLPNTLSYIKYVEPKLAVLTHMSHQLDYDKLLEETPDNVVPGYDGMLIYID